MRVEIVGDDLVQKQLRAFGAAAGELDSFDRIGLHMKKVAMAIVPTQTGALARSIEVNVNRNRASISAGGPSRRSHGGGVYAGIAEYGTYTHSNKGPRPYMRTALKEGGRYAMGEIENELDRLAKRFGLD